MWSCVGLQSFANVCACLGCLCAPCGIHDRCAINVLFWRTVQVRIRSPLNSAESLDMPKRENGLSNYYMSSVFISESFRSYMSKIFKDDILRSKPKFAHVCSLFACFALRFTKVVAHQHLPIFHTEHCVFCRFLSNGNDYTDPGSCTYATLKVHMSKI